MSVETHPNLTWTGIHSHQISTIPTRITRIHLDPNPTRIRPDSRWNPTKFHLEPSTLSIPGSFLVHSQSIPVFLTQSQEWQECSVGIHQECPGLVPVIPYCY